MRHLPGRRLLLALVAALVAAGAAGGIAYATGAVGASDPSMVSVCVNKAGAARFVDAAKQCKKDEHAVLLEAAAAAQPTQFLVDCGAGRTVQAVLDQVADGLVPVTIGIKGTCNEDVTVARDGVMLVAASQGAGVRGIELDGARGIRISGLAVGVDGVQSEASQFTADGIDVNGAQTALWVDSGSVANVNDSTIENATDGGVFVSDASTLSLGNASITDSGNWGITVKAAHATLDNVRIAGNFNGVEVQFGGAADLVGCTVEHNHFGIHTFDGSSANVVASTVQFNDGGGVNAQSGDVNVQGTVVQHNMFGVTGTNGARITLQGGAGVEENQTGLMLTVGSSAELQGAIVIQNNHGNGVQLGDTSVINIPSEAQITHNDAWGVWCEPGSPAVIREDSGGLGGVTGNAGGDVGCTVVM